MLTAQKLDPVKHNSARALFEGYREQCQALEEALNHFLGDAFALFSGE